MENYMSISTLKYRPFRSVGRALRWPSLKMLLLPAGKQHTYLFWTAWVSFQRYFCIFARPSTADPHCRRKKPVSVSLVPGIQLTFFVYMSWIRQQQLIEDIRSLNERYVSRHKSANYKVYMLMRSICCPQAAFNAFTKTMEPPSSCHLHPCRSGKALNNADYSEPFTPVVTSTASASREHYRPSPYVAKLEHISARLTWLSLLLKEADGGGRVSFHLRPGSGFTGGNITYKVWLKTWMCGLRILFQTDRFGWQQSSRICCF